jgi:hypothetical protein
MNFLPFNEHTEVDLMVLARHRTYLRCLDSKSGIIVNLRPVADAVPGESVKVYVQKIAMRLGEFSFRGSVTKKDLNLSKWKLQPLELYPRGVWDPKDEDWSEMGALRKYYRRVRTAGIRPMFEMEQVILGQDPENWDSDPIIDASDCMADGYVEQALLMMEDILTQDMRCIDAHAHLGNWLFNSARKRDVELALRHYQVGVGIGNLTLGRHFQGVLPWGLIDNRPYLRALHGMGLCQWYLGWFESAEKIFRQMLWFNPMDHQGVRFLLQELQDGVNWQESNLV